MLEFISDFGKPSAPFPAAIVACVPKTVHVDGLGETEFGITPGEITTAITSGLEGPIEPEPEVSFTCLLQFELPSNSIADLFVNGLQIEVPKELISSSQLQELRLQRRPSFIPIGPGVNVTKIHDKETGITQRRLSNGIPINYKVSLRRRILILEMGSYL